MSAEVAFVDFRAARPVRRAKTPIEVLAGKLHICAGTYGCSDARGLKVDAIAAKFERLAQHPNPASYQQAKALVAEFVPLAHPGFIPAALKPYLAKLFCKVLATPPTAATPIVIRLADRRAQIRQSRAYEATTGPPR